MVLPSGRRRCVCHTNSATEATGSRTSCRRKRRDSTSQSLQNRPLKGLEPDDAAAQKNACDLSILLPVVRLVRRGAFTHHRQGDAMHIQPYLFFDGRCEEAVEFYQKTLGAEVMMLMRFQDSPEPPQPGMMDVWVGRTGQSSGSSRGRWSALTEA